MKISRYYNKDTTEKMSLIKDKEIVIRLLTVMHYRVGDTLSFFNGLDNFDYLFSIKSINKKELCVEFIEKKINTVSNENKIRKINAFLSITKQDYDEMVREMVEIGISEITPTISERSEKKNINETRLSKIITEACEQSGRSIIPKLNKTIILKDFSASSEENVCYHTKEVSQNAAPSPTLHEGEKEVLNIFIGPEGGYSDGEIDWMQNNNFKFKNLKTNILRAKTAAAICAYDALLG